MNQGQCHWCSVPRRIRTTQPTMHYGLPQKRKKCKLCLPDGRLWKPGVDFYPKTLSTGSNKWSFVPLWTMCVAKNSNRRTCWLVCCMSRNAMLIKCLQAIALVPLQAVSDKFDVLVSALQEERDEILGDFLTYVGVTWIGPLHVAARTKKTQPAFPQELWNVKKWKGFTRLASYQQLDRGLA